MAARGYPVNAPGFLYGLLLLGEWRGKFRGVLTNTGSRIRTLLSSEIWYEIISCDSLYGGGGLTIIL